VRWKKVNHLLRKVNVEDISCRRAGNLTDGFLL
jgi:hypothetical protein